VRKELGIMKLSVRLGPIQMIDKAIKTALAARMEKAKNAQTLVSLLDTIVTILIGMRSSTDRSCKVSTNVAMKERAGVESEKKVGN
jgi:hypothetical protein